MQAFLFLTALAAASAVDCRKRTIPDFLCLLTAAAGLISFSPAQFFGVLAALPLLIAALIRPECMGGGDIKLTAAAGFVLGFWRGIWGMALGLLLAVLYFCTAMLFQKFIHHPLPAMTRAALYCNLSLINCRGGIFKPFPKPSGGAYPMVRESA